MNPDATPENMDSILRRVQKLLAMAADNRGNPEETAAAASMAAKIMRKYQLEHSDVIIASLNKGEGMAEDWIVGTSSTDGRAKTVPGWVQWMAVALAKVHDLRVSQTRVPAGKPQAGDGCIRFAGFASDVQVASWTLAYLVAQVNRLTDGYRKTIEYQIKGRKSSAAFRDGVASGICKLILASKAEEVQTSSGTALVVAKSRAVAEHFGENKFTKSKKDIKDARAYAAGYEAGQKVDVNRRAVGSTANSGALRIGR